ncbi:atypical chemokine receptor 1 [Hemicordylus capensis]|uniref:atypical chemokine receptor 1 n=1 Tax=Hemicordylus capensis TaxID=884348 RepID=UPI002302FD44|nr:atypical chemokine receptor 1 [Hemicordylus capensis]
MDSCFPTVTNQAYELTYSTDWEDLVDAFGPNSSEASGDNYYEDFPEPCHGTYCSTVGPFIPGFLAIASCLGVLSNTALAISLATRPPLWGQRHRPGRTVLSLMAAASAIFAAILPFFAVGFRHRWIFGSHFCRVARVLKSGGLFAQGLLGGGSGRAPPSWLLPTALWATGFVLATPAAVISSPGEVCVSSQEAQLHLWSWAHGLFCLALFLFLPLVAVLATANRRRLRCGGNLHLGITWVFYLFWAPYGVAMILDRLVQENQLTRDCHQQEFLDYFLGFSEALGVSHCFLCPVLILGVSSGRVAQWASSSC